MSDHSAAQEELEQIHALIKNGIADTMDIYGVNRSVGQLYATLYLSDEPMTLDQLRDELGMSKGSMSLGVRKLLEEKIIHRVYRKGERKDLYQAEQDFFQFFISFFTRRWEREKNVNLYAVKQAQPRYQALMEDPDTPEDVRAEAERHFNKINDSLQYYRFLDILVEEFEEGDLAQKLLERHNKRQASEL
ncbi:GbsR/MarR family transcriptional regulator [Geomicrobium sp. JCM 19055]|uniref:GbsR/MarR family transcriptional regulator n=1 Tax=Geomicrobium sp. JCM 19055 TaxID=1460649 RepID=UPI00045EDD5E|nr:transcriptional regulator [Geomicrobium sp. JCM 19055]GAJ98465.1 betaine operon transcriptional regulator [Geomicrobium sp. JCM 19055]